MRQRVTEIYIEYLGLKFWHACQNFEIQGYPIFDKIILFLRNKIYRRYYFVCSKFSDALKAIPQSVYFIDKTL